METRSEGDVVLRAVGDIALIGRAARALVESSDPSWSATASFLSEADITFANFEMAIPRSDVERSGVDVSPDLVGDPEALSGLLEAGVDVMSLATNHIMDWGDVALRETIEELRGHGVEVVGAGETLEEAVAGRVIERRGLRVGFCAFTPPHRWTATQTRPGAAPLTLENVRTSLAGMSDADVRVVSLHWGIEMSNYPTPDDRALASSIIDAGADLILGHHPHVIQGIERREAGWVVYSMGNFIFDIVAGRVEHRYDPWDLRAGYLVDARIGREGVASLSAVPTMVGESGLGALASDPDRERIATLVRSVSDNLDRGSEEVWEHAGGKLVAHKLRCLWRSFLDGGPAAVARELAHFRLRHVRLAFGYLRSRLIRKKD
jgi:hypothetical protein